MAVGDIYEVSVDSTVKGEHCANVFHYLETVAETDTIPAENLAEGFVAAVEAAWVDLLSNLGTLNCVFCRRVKPTFGVAFTRIWNVVGTVAVDALPTTSAALITWYTTLASKRGRGRSYLAGLPETAQDGGLLEDAFITLVNALADDLEGPVAGGAGGTGVWNLCVYSRLNGTAQDVVAFVARSNMATQRGRRQRPGVA